MVQIWKLTPFQLFYELNALIGGFSKTPTGKLFLFSSSGRMQEKSVSECASAGAMAPTLDSDDDAASNAQIILSSLDKTSS